MHIWCSDVSYGSMTVCIVRGGLNQQASPHRNKSAEDSGTETEGVGSSWGPPWRLKFWLRFGV